MYPYTKLGPIFSTYLNPKSTILKQNCQISHFYVNQLFSGDPIITHWTKWCLFQPQPPGPYVSWSAPETQNDAIVPDIGCTAQHRCDQHPVTKKKFKHVQVFKSFFIISFFCSWFLSFIHFWNTFFYFKETSSGIFDKIKVGRLFRTLTI